MTLRFFHRITSDRFDFLAESAAQLFPPYSKKTFYCRATKDTAAH